MRLSSRFALTAVLLASATACMDDSTSVELPPAADPATTTFAPALGIDLAAMTKSSTGLYVRDDVVGDGAEVADGKAVSVQYEGWVSSGGDSFDEGTLPFESFPRIDADFADSRVIPGFEEGVRGMKVGGTRTIVIPPQLAYGYQAQQDQSGRVVIPSNSVIVFRITPLGVQ